MDKPISVGDLVIVVRNQFCCPHPKPHVGKPFVVTGFRIIKDACPRCGDSRQLTAALGDGLQRGYDIRRLKRIPPFADLDGLESEEVDKLPSPRLVEAAKRYKRLVTSK